MPTMPQRACASGVSTPSPIGATWLNGSYDPESKVIYWGTGNPNPDYDGDARPGDNLYTACVVALEAGSGKLRWHYQFTPHDVWDYDGVNEMVLADLHVDGHTIKGLLHAERNGHFYALDRSNGKFPYARPFVRATWAKSFNDGRTVVSPDAIPTVKGVEVCPGAGGKEWNPMSFSPLTRLVYLPAIENCAVFSNYGVNARRMRDYRSGGTLFVFALFEPGASQAFHAGSRHP